MEMTAEQYFKKLEDIELDRMARLTALLSDLVANLKEALPDPQPPTPEEVAAQKAGQERHYRLVVAASALQGMIANGRSNQSNDDIWYSPEYAANMAVQYADALIAELGKRST